MAALRRSRSRGSRTKPRALAIDQAYAAAWAGLAIASHQFAEGRPRDEAEGLRRRAIDAAEKAVALAPDRPEALASRGWLLLHSLGRLDEAAAEARQAIDLDPLATQPWNSLGSILTSMGQLAEARRTLERALELAEKIPWEATRLAAIARAEHDLGRVEDSKKTLDALATRFATTDALWIANVHAWRGDRDAAFKWLERALQQPGWIGSAKTDPVFRKLRGDPRWNALLRKMNLPLD